MKKVCVAAAQYAIQNFDNFQSYAEYHTEMVERVKTQDINVLLLPEYAGLALVDMTQSAAIVFENIQTILPQYIALFEKLAKLHQIYIVPGTLPVADGNGKFFNRAYFFTPQGYFFQDKMILTQGEIEVNILRVGEKINLFDTVFGKMAIAICYDSEFPMLVQAMTTAGADIILVPSCTDTLAGYYRVHLSCRARALENQCYVVNAYLVGQAPWCGEMSEHVGAAGIFSPVDTDFPDDGILMLGDMNKVQLVVYELDLAKIAWVREHGTVRNFHDMQYAKNRFK